MTTSIATKKQHTNYQDFEWEFPRPLKKLIKVNQLMMMDRCDISSCPPSCDPDCESLFNCSTWNFREMPREFTFQSAPLKKHLCEELVRSEMSRLVDLKRMATQKPCSLLITEGESASKYAKEMLRSLD